MNAPLRRLCALVGFGLPLLAFLLAGCGQPVREDRSINWSGEGQSVGFQHGEDGIFIADKDSGQMTKIFQPGANVLATSSPLWSPQNKGAGKRLIFTTARSGSGQQQNVNLTQLFGAPSDPAGKVYLQQQVIYTCYLYEETPGEPPSKPTELFVEVCGHVGYVAANLAVRWHPSGQRVLYIKQFGNGKHGLFEFDLASKTSRSVLPHKADDLIFDWTPDGSRLVCLLASKQPDANDGIWIGHPDGPNWAHVPESEHLAQADLPSVLEKLRATRPAWTPDGTHFAFPTHTPGNKEDDPGRSYLRLGSVVPGNVETLAEGMEPFRDLRWAPDGVRLGVVRGSDNASLHIAQKGGNLSAPINRKPVRQFAGWNGAGNRLAYIVPAGKPLVESEEWAFILLPDERARDAVYVADGAGNEPGTEVFSGMRVTFPQWSPTEDKLSLWVTFTPTHYSWVSLFLGGGLRPGDPAAVFDATTGHFTWMAVNPHEQIQVGHYYLSKHEYLLAWRWYEKAEAAMPAPKPAESKLTLDAIRDLSEPRDISFFQYYCLMKLGRNEEAQAKLAGFRKTFPPRAEQFKGQIPIQGMDEQIAQVLDPDGFFSPLLRDLYCAQVFLSLDAADDGETYFRDELKGATTDGARLSSSLVLGQMLLLDHKHTDYATLLTDAIAPLLLKLAKPLPPNATDALKVLQSLVGMIQMMAQLPMCDPEFLAHISKKELAVLVPRWESLRAEANSEDARRGIDMVLHAAYQQLGKEQERKAISQRLWSNPDGPPPNEDIRKQIAEMRLGMKAMSQRQF